MKKEIETKSLQTHFAVLGDEPRCRSHSSPNRSRCRAFHNLSHGFYRVMSVKFPFFFFFLGFQSILRRVFIPSDVSWTAVCKKKEEEGGALAINVTPLAPDKPLLSYGKDTGPKTV